MIVSRPKAMEAADVLGVALDGLTPSALTKAYHRKAKECHPDHHGHKNLQQWARVSWSKDCLDNWLEHHKPEPFSLSEIAKAGDCRACGGSGRIVIAQRSFGTPLTMGCVICNGEGTVTPMEYDGD